MLLDVKIVCSCNNHIDGAVYVPHPNYLSDSEENSLSEHWEEIWCPSCGKEFKVYVAKTFNDLKCYINDNSVKFSFGLPYENKESAVEQYFSDENVDIFMNQINSSEILLKIEVSKDVEFNLLVMIHGHVVSAVERYLASVCINRIVESPDLMRKLLESDKELGNIKFTLKSLFSEYENIENTIANYLKKLIFHKIDKVKPMYKSIFDIDFGNIQWLFLSVNIRHDCVHRGGYTKEGNKVNLTRDKILALINNSRGLIEKIEYKLKDLD
ncbi:hypothetical protein [Photobacterium damselae]|uniref:hypothetical protein n=1 Tax=Photobacterium damselae TaxID=38293 RepID=UPI001F440ADA|nr:hypothetical protein [Photobacterium damselae]UKA09163.1 hypothetical protein IHC91_08990 [Photobacterium damselae subsp. damselae]